MECLWKAEAQWAYIYGWTGQESAARQLHLCFSDQACREIYKLREDIRTTLNFPTQKTEYVKGLKVLTNVPLSMHDPLFRYSREQSRYKLRFTNRFTLLKHQYKNASGSHRRALMCTSLFGDSAIPFKAAMTSLEHRLTIAAGGQEGLTDMQ